MKLPAQDRATIDAGTALVRQIIGLKELHQTFVALQQS
jgi:hypothetical protein